MHTTSDTTKWTAIRGWAIRYFEPTFGMRDFFCVGWDARAQLKDALVWLDAGGYAYSIKEVAK